MKKYKELIKTRIFIAILFFSLGFMFSYFLLIEKCDKKENASINMDMAKTNNTPSRPIWMLEEKILNDGCVDCYEELNFSYFDRNLYEFLPWALIMANKFNSKVGYFDVYFSLHLLSNIAVDSKTIENWSLDKLDKKTQEMAIEYLKIAADKGHEQAKEILGGYYLEGKYVEKNTELGTSLINESRESRKSYE